MQDEEPLLSPSGIPMSHIQHGRQSVPAVSSSNSYFGLGLSGPRASFPSYTPLALPDNASTSNQTAYQPPVTSPPAQTPQTPPHGGGPRPHDTKEFWRTKQLRETFSVGFFRWVLTMALIAGAAFALYDYSLLEVMGESTKLVFNTIMTGLAICLSLNLASAFKALIIQMRWKILASHPHTLHDVDRILGIDSFWETLKICLSYQSSTSIFLKISLSFWLLLNIGSQIGVAFLGLTYSLDNYDSFLAFQHGAVSVPNMTWFTPANGNSADSPQGSNQFLSHLYGDIATSYESDFINNSWSNTNALYFMSEDRQTFTYRFRDLLPENPSKFVLTNRTINATSSCIELPFSWSGGLSISFTYLGVDYGGDTLLGGDSSIVYILPGQLAFNYCGNGCSTIWALQWPTATDNTYHLYWCNTSLTNVSNTYNPAHEASLLIRELATAAIGLSGYTNLSQPQNDEFESNRYISDSYWGSPPGNDVQGMQSLTANYAIGVIAAVAELNTKITLPQGQRPFDGVKLNVDWLHAGIVFGCIGIGHLVIFLAATFIANNVVLQDESHLAVARLLKPHLTDASSLPTFASGKRIAEMRAGSFIYSARNMQYGQQPQYRLEIATESAPGFPRRDYFPEGLYE